MRSTSHILFFQGANPWSVYFLRSTEQKHSLKPSSRSISNCFMPTLPSCTTSRTLRKIGYYAGWGNRRVNCSDSNVSPDQIDFTGYTHAQFAFATISQALTIRSSLRLYSFSSSDYLIRWKEVTSDDDLLLRQLVAQKTRYSGLNVLIAVGGWDFSYVIHRNF